MIEGRDFAAAGMIGARKRQEDNWSVQVVSDDGTDDALLLAAVASRIAEALMRRVEGKAFRWQDNATVVVVCPVTSAG